MVHPHIHGRVLEVGAGQGANTQLLCKRSEIQWTCMEPDPKLAGEICKRIENGVLPKNCENFQGVFQNLPASFPYNTILYIDVLENIQDDWNEVRQAVNHLSTVGKLIVLGPAHNWLYSEFDSAIGHFRRYARKTLPFLATQNLLLEKTVYLDSAGFFLSLGHRLLFHRKMPSQSQIMFWDRWIVPLSQRLDPLLVQSMGKSVLGVWQR